MNDEFLQAARKAWRRDPESAAVAILGVSAETLFCEAVKAARGCNQHKHKPGCPDAGHEGSGSTEKKSETPEERTKRIVVGAIKNAKSTLEELNKKVGKPPYDINDPRARAKINLEHELTRTQERDTEEAAERLNQVTESAKKTLAKGNSMSEYLAKSLTDDIYEIALEDGGYESLYDAPKDKLKAAIMKELQATPKDEADKLGDDAYDSYKWWRKRKEKIAKSLK